MLKPTESWSRRRGLLFIAAMIALIASTVPGACGAASDEREPSWIEPLLAATPTARLVVYGPEALTREGDQDYTQVIFIAVPEHLEQTLYLRVFDADTGADHDTSYGPTDTETRFTVLGQGLVTAAQSATAAPGEGHDSALAGTVIAQRGIGSDPALNNKWSTLAELSAAQGEPRPDRGERLFKLVVQGLSGNDGNVIDVAVSARADRNLPVPGARLYTYAPTLRLEQPGVVAEARFTVPVDSNQLSIANFDAARGLVALELPLRSVALTASGQDEWRRDPVPITPNERGQTAALLFGGGREMPNDGTFVVLSDSGQPVAIDLPIYLWGRNHRPKPKVSMHWLGDCHTLVLDASASADADGDLLDYAWSFGDGERGRGAVVVHRYAAAGQYPVGLTVSDRSGQVGNATATELPVVLNQPPRAAIAALAPVAPGARVRLDAAGSSDSDGRIRAYRWHFGDGAKGKGRRTSHRYKHPGHYRLSVEVSDDSGSPCASNRAETLLWVNAAPTAVALAPAAVSIGDEVLFDGSRSFDRDGNNGSGLSYQWDLGDGSSATEATVHHRYTRAGRYAVRLTVSDDSGAANASDSDELTVVVNAAPVADAGADRRAAVGEVLVFDGSASADADGRLVDYVWDFGNGDTASGARVAYAYAAPGRYSVSLTVLDDSDTGSASATDTLGVVVNQPPRAAAGDDRRLTRSEVRFDGSGSVDADGRIGAYHWDFGDGGTSEQARPVHSYAAPGVYRVRLSVSDDSATARNSASDETMVRVNALPVADAGGGGAAAPGQALRFQARASFDPDGEVTDYRWDFGDGASGSGMEVAHAYAAPGVYTVGLTVADDSGDAEALDYSETRALINAPPVADAGADQLVAPGQPVLLDGGGSFDPDGAIRSWRWEVDGREGRHEGPRYQLAFEQAGAYTVRLTVRDDSRALNSIAVDDVLVRVNHAPQARPGADIVTADSTVVLDGSASSDQDGDALSYRWDLGDGSPPRVGARLSHTYATGGDYPVTLQVDDGSGLINASDVAALKVSINRAPQARAGEHRSICAGDVLLFDGSGSSDPEGGLLKYHWDFGDGSSAQGINPTKVYSRGGSYAVTLTVDDDSGLPGNRSSDRSTVTVIDSPIAVAGADQRVCANTEVRFDGSASRDRDGVVNRFLWDFGDGRGSASGLGGGGPKPLHVYTEPGEHRVKLLIEGDRVGQCDFRHSDELTVTVVSAPLAVIDAPSVVASGAQVSFDAGGSSGAGAEIIAWEWDFGDGETATGAKVEHRYSQAGDYPVVLTVRTGGDVAACREVSARQHLRVNQAPVAAASLPADAGVNQELLFDASASADGDGVIRSYEWDLGDGSRASGVQVRHRYASPGRYPVVLRVTDDSGAANGSAEHSATVKVNAPPQPVIAARGAACVGETLSFSGAGSRDRDGAITAYRWDFGDGHSAEGVEAAHVYAAPGLYNVSLAVDDDLGVNNSDGLAVATLMINRPPVADAGPDRRACPGQALSFDGAHSRDPDGSLAAFSWNFGDGSTAQGAKVEHSYAQPGTYTLNLAVSDDSQTACGSANDRATIVVNAAPVANAGGDREALVGGAHDALVFDATASSDPDGDPLRYRWDFGDGQVEEGAIVTHGYREPGRYEVSLQVQDDSGTVCERGVEELVVTARRRAADGR